MDRVTDMQYQINEGADVRSADDEKLGKVVGMQQGYLVVEKGFFFPTDYYVPTSAVANYDGDTVYLNVSKDEALNSGWNLNPGAELSTGTVAAGTYDTSVNDTLATDTTVNAGYADTTVGTGYTDDLTTQPFEHASHEERGAHVHADDRLVVPVHEEELTATKRAVERGQVRVEKDVIAEERTLEVPVTEERVTVSRRVVDRPVSGDETTFEEAVIDVPLHGEEVELQKRTRVAEEIEIGKEAVQHTERVAGTVRREEVRVDDATTTTGTVRTSATDVVDDVTGRTNR
jgi:uncharacterized protein (TIGR02271 family)